MTNPEPGKDVEPTFHVHWAHQLRDAKQQGINPRQSNLTVLFYRKVEHEKGEVELYICRVCHYIEAKCLHTVREYVDRKWQCTMCQLELEGSGL